MSATPPPALEGTETPNPFEVLWERYRSLIIVVVTAILLALVGNYALKYMERRGIDENWSTFAVKLGMAESYTDIQNAGDSLIDALEDVPMADLESALAAADEVQKPYVHLAIARKAMLEADWARAETALAAIESGYPKHTLVTRSKQPVQTRDPKKPEDPDNPPDEPQWEPASEGSVIAMMREQIADARGFEMPARFQKPSIPDDAKKVKFTVGDYGSFTVALMPQAPQHAEKFLELAKAGDSGWWTGVAVDEIRRSTEMREQPYSLHFGFDSTREDDRTKWTTTEPSEHQIDWEETGLSHFPGAVAARPGDEGQSAVNRLWISVDDEARMDGSRVVFGYVVEGLDTLRAICDVGMSAEEEDRGQGRPTENIRVTAVEVL